MLTGPVRKISTVTKPEIVLPKRKESLSNDTVSGSNNSNSNKNEKDRKNNITSDLELKLDKLKIDSIPESTAMWVMGSTPSKDEKLKPRLPGIILIFQYNCFFLLPANVEFEININFCLMLLF